MPDSNQPAKKVLVIEPIHAAGEALLQAHPDLDLEVVPEAGEAALVGQVGAADAIIVRNSPMSRAVIEAAPRLQIISRHGVGYDNVDLEAAGARGIPVAITAKANALSVAEHTLMMMLALAKDAIWYDRSLRQEGFAGRRSHRCVDLAGRRVLIVGVGRIGRRVAALCQAFGLRVWGADPYLSDAELRARHCEPLRDWHRHLPEVDILTLHTPRTEETIGILSADVLAALPAHAIVINCARGGLLDEDALHAALTGGRLRAAGIDVFDQEPPPPDHPLLALDNVLFSPHSAAATKEGMRRMGLDCAQAVIDFFAGELDPGLVVNAEVLAEPAVP